MAVVDLVSCGNRLHRQPGAGDALVLDGIDDVGNWLERACAFAMHALDQVDRLRAATGRGRYWLFTGDIGAALLAAACMSGDTRLPGLDDL